MVTLSGRFWADLLGAFWGDLVGTFLGDFSGHFLLSPGAATVAMQFCFWGVFVAQFCVLQAMLSFVPIVSIANFPSVQHYVIFKSSTHQQIGIIVPMRSCTAQ